jgi:hypothetical protein
VGGQLALDPPVPRLVDSTAFSSGISDLGLQERSDTLYAIMEPLSQCSGVEFVVFCLQAHQGSWKQETLTA